MASRASASYAPTWRCKNSSATWYCSPHGACSRARQPADGHRDRRQAAPRTRASAARHTRREGPRREVMIRHRHWRESGSEPDGAAAPRRRLRRQHIPYCYPTVATGAGRRSLNTVVRSPPRTSGEPGDQFSLAQASGRPRSCAFSISADTREGGRRHEGKYPRRMLARALPRGAAIHPYTSVHTLF